MYYNHTQCRVCGAKDLIPVFDLGVQPLANDFTSEGQDCAGFAPLKVLHCEACALGQLSVVVKPQILYANYPYVTSTSMMMATHFDKVLALIKQWPHGRLLEIGSNDGGFLRHCKKNGIVDVVGIDPAENLAEYANSIGIKTAPGVFTPGTAQWAGRCDLVIARHVFCHVDDWHLFINSLDFCTHDDSTVFIEVPYLLDMLHRIEFDTIYHEHTSYLSILSVVRLLADTPWYLERVERFPIHGGAVGLVIRRRKQGSAIHKSVSDMLAGESDVMGDWRYFSNTARERIERLSNVVGDLFDAGDPVCGFGASAKSTVWINACGFNSHHIKFICDCTPQKQGKFSPGSSIPIVPESRLGEASYAVMWCWNFKQEVLAKQAAFRAAGGKFIIPPEITIE